MNTKGINLINEINNGDFSEGCEDWRGMKTAKPTFTITSAIAEDGTCRGCTNGVDWKIEIDDNGYKWFTWEFRGINLTDKGLDGYEPYELARVILGDYFSLIEPEIIPLPEKAKSWTPIFTEDKVEYKKNINQVDINKDEIVNPKDGKLGSEYFIYNVNTELQEGIIGDNQVTEHNGILVYVFDKPIKIEKKLDIRKFLDELR